MKNMIFVLAFLMAGTASAAIGKATVCSSDDNSKYVEFEFLGPVIRQTSHNGASSRVNDIPLKEAYDADQGTLDQASQKYKLPAFVYGEFWFVRSGALLIALDANGIQYVFTTGNGEISYLGSSATCK